MVESARFGVLSADITSDAVFRTSWDEISRRMETHLRVNRSIFRFRTTLSETFFDYERDYLNSASFWTSRKEYVMIFELAERLKLVGFLQKAVRPDDGHSYPCRLEGCGWSFLFS
jgi:hypothetical protein